MKKLLSTFGEVGFYRIVFAFIAVAFPAEAYVSQSLDSANVIRLFISCLCFFILLASLRSEFVKKHLQGFYCLIALATILELSYMTSQTGLTTLVAIEGYFTSTILSNFFSRRRYFNIFVVASSLIWAAGAFHVKSFVSPMIFMAAIVTIYFVVGVATRTRIQLIKQIQDKSMKLDALLQAFPDKYYFVSETGDLHNNSSSLASIFEVFPENLKDDVRLKLKETLFKAATHVFEFSDNAGRIFEARFVPQTSSRLVVMIRDISSRKALEIEANRKAGELLLASRQASIGRLAGGIAHEINNPLNAVILSARQTAVCHRKGLKEQLPKSVQNLQLSFKRIESIISAISIMGDDRRGTIGNHTTTKDVFSKLKLLSQNFENVSIEYRNDFPDVAVKISLDLATEALSQIVKNARDAVCVQSGTGRVAVSVVKQGQEVTFTVVDNGAGIPSEQLEKVFDPFFSTKAIGTAQGLGLSVAKGIALRHGGDVELSSVPGQTRVTMRVPVSQ